MDLGRWIDAEGRVPLFFAAGALVLVFGFLGILAMTGAPFTDGQRGDPTGPAPEAATMDVTTIDDVTMSLEPEVEEEAHPPEADVMSGTRPADREAPPTSPPAGRIHEVAAGETLYGIAQQHYGNGQHWRLLVDANQLDASGMVLRAGRKLIVPDLPVRIPGAGPATVSSQPAVESAGPATVTAGATYEVQPGDTWWSIAARSTGSGKNWVEIARANPGIEPEAPLPVGKSIVIPDQP